METFEHVLLEQIASTDLQSISSPYLTKTFAQWRSIQFQQYSGPLSEFIELFDNIYLPKFLKCVSNAYQIAILNDPSISSLPKHDQVVSDLIKVLTQWSIELELAVDLIERAKLYKLYEVPHGFSDLFDELKSEWRTSESISHRLYKKFLRYLIFASEHAKSYISDTLKGYILDNVLQNKGNLIASIFYSYFCSTVPWPVIALLGTQCVTIVSAVVMTKVGDGITDKLERAELRFKAEEIKNKFEVLIADLMYRNEYSQKLIQKIAEKRMESDLIALSEHFNAVLCHKELKNNGQEEFDEDQYIVNNSKIELDEEGWLVLEPPDLDIQQFEDWMIVGN